MLVKPTVKYQVQYLNESRANPRWEDIGPPFTRQPNNQEGYLEAVGETLVRGTQLRFIKRTEVAVAHYQNPS